MAEQTSARQKIISIFNQEKNVDKKLIQVIKKCLFYPGKSFTLKLLFDEYENLNKTSIIDAFEFIISKKICDEKKKYA